MSLGLVGNFDESARGSLYIGVLAVHEGASTRSVDRLVRAHRLPWQRRFHAKNESEARLRAFLGRCVTSELLRAWVYKAPLPAKPARQAIVYAMAVDAIKNGVGRLVLERGNPSDNRVDRQEIARALRATGGDIPYSHDP